MSVYRARIVDRIYGKPDGKQGLDSNSLTCIRADAVYEPKA
jgi:hypothetical protein